MSYRRRYVGRFSRGQKWSNETNAFGMEISAPVSNVSWTVVDYANLQGMRKAKNFRLSLTCQWPDSAEEGDARCMYWALIYIPEGRALNPMFANTPSLYEPSQDVVMSGVILPSGESLDGMVVNAFSPIARNLNSNDKLVLVVSGARIDSGSGPMQWTSIPIGASFSGTLNYAVTL